MFTIIAKHAIISSNEYTIALLQWNTPKFTISSKFEFWLIDWANRALLISLAHACIIVWTQLTYCCWKPSANPQSALMWKPSSISSQANNLMYIHNSTSRPLTSDFNSPMHVFWSAYIAFTPKQIASCFWSIVFKDTGLIPLEGMSALTDMNTRVILLNKWVCAQTFKVAFTQLKSFRLLADICQYASPYLPLSHCIAIATAAQQQIIQWLSSFADCRWTVYTSHSSATVFCSYKQLLYLTQCSEGPRRMKDLCAHAAGGLFFFSWTKARCSPVESPWP